MLDLRHMRTFQAVALQNSFSRAAVMLNYVQSSVTAQIKALEAELGVPLFDRLGRRVELTSAGRQLLEYAERLLSLAEETQLAVSHHKEPSGTIIVSAPETLLSYRLPSLLQEFQRRFPAVQLSLGSGSSCVPNNVIETKVDIAFTIDLPIVASNLVIATLHNEPIKLLVSRGHPLAGKDKTRSSDFRGEQFLITNSSCSYRTLFQRTLQSDGEQLGRFLEFENVEAIKQCALANMGIAVLPIAVAAEEIASGRLISLDWPDKNHQMVVHTQMLRHRSKWLSPAIAAFWNLALSISS